MDNIILLNVLFWEFEREIGDKTLHIDDINAIERVHRLLEKELPRKEV